MNTNGRHTLLSAHVLQRHYKLSGARHANLDPRIPHCRALPPSEFNGMISQPLPVYAEKFVTITIRLYNVTMFVC